MSGTRRAVVVGLTAASIGVIYGYDISSIAGALLFITDQFKLSTGQQELVTAAVAVGEVAGALSAGMLANAIGRKRSLVLVVAGYAVFAAMAALSLSLPMLLVARLLLGLTIGVSVVVVPVFVAESAPAAWRGSLLVAYQVATVTGIVAGYLSAYVLAGSQNWRLMLGLAAVPAVAVLLVTLRMPDTARWYLLKGRVADARSVLRRVQTEASGEWAERELAEIASAIGEERGAVVGELLRRPYLRATVFLVGLGFFIQITGINAIVYYSPRLFAAMGFAGNFALLVLPALVQVAGLTAVVASLMLVDRVGRRPLLLTGIGTMIVADAVLIGAGAVRRAPMIGLAGVLLFTVGFTFGFGALVWVYAGESLPSRLRSIGSSAMLTANLIGNTLVAGLFLTVLQTLGSSGAFAVFGVFAVAAFVFVYRFAPETKGVQLEEIRHFWENGGRWVTDQPAALQAVTDAP